MINIRVANKHFHLSEGQLDKFCILNMLIELLINQDVQCK
jgi:hypothetical protein